MWLAAIFAGKATGYGIEDLNDKSLYIVEVIVQGAIGCYALYFVNFGLASMVGARLVQNILVALHMPMQKHESKKDNIWISSYVT